MIPKDCKRLAEVDFPIAEVSRHAAREKSIRHGHPNTLHFWWARRPLASSRVSLLYVDKRCVAEDRCEYCWLYVVKNCGTKPQLKEPNREAARFEWNEVAKVAKYYLSIGVLTRSMLMREGFPLCRN